MHSRRIGCAYLATGLRRMSALPTSRQGTRGIPHSLYISTRAVVGFEVVPKDGSSLLSIIIFSCLAPNTWSTSSAPAAMCLDASRSPTEEEITFSIKVHSCETYICQDERGQAKGILPRQGARAGVSVNHQDGQDTWLPRPSSARRIKSD